MELTDGNVADGTGNGADDNVISNILSPNTSHLLLKY